MPSHPTKRSGIRFQRYKQRRTKTQKKCDHLINNDTFFTSQEHINQTIVEESGVQRPLLDIKIDYPSWETQEIIPLEIYDADEIMDDLLSLLPEGLLD